MISRVGTITGVGLGDNGEDTRAGETSTGGGPKSDCEGLGGGGGTIGAEGGDSEVDGSGGGGGTIEGTEGGGSGVDGSRRGTLGRVKEIDSAVVEEKVEEDRG